MQQLSPYISYKTDERGNGYLEIALRGFPMLRMSALNKGTAFTREERAAFSLEGLLPPRVTTLDDQVRRVYQGYLKLDDDIEKYQYLRACQERSEVIFFKLLEQHLDEMMPIVYTPTVGKAVQQYSDLYQRPRGLTVSVLGIDHIDQVVDDYPWHDVRMIVATDSSAILGIGDQGVGGLAISIGKLALYTAGGGLSPFHTMPVCLDVGTNNEKLLNDPNYLGVHRKRLSGDAYFDMLDRFVDSVQRRWPKAVIQWEDFAKDVAFRVLDRYRERVPCFNDDIQGTGAVVLAGLLSACKKLGQKLSDQRIVVVGAGAGGVGVARAIQEGLVHEGLDREQARRQMFVMDAAGLVVEELIEPDSYQQPVSQFSATYSDWNIAGDRPSLMEVLDHAQPTILLGLTGVGNLFDREIIERMAANCEQPIIFPLSNPTANCEAVPEEIIRWTDGKALVAAGSPFGPVDYEGTMHAIGQGNNAFVFPGIGFAAVLGKCRRISEAMILESAYAVADYTDKHHLHKGLFFPPISELRDVSLYVTERVLRVALEDGSSTRTDLDDVDLREYVHSRAWKADYLPFMPAPGKSEEPG
ncbi:MAG: NAD-dependent malic enzyme [Chromatiales bacterium]|jgi:malate dehydrogenase (oxaloacetate-decarboxylating)